MQLTRSDHMIRAVKEVGVVVHTTDDSCRCFLIYLSLLPNFDPKLTKLVAYYNNIKHASAAHVAAAMPTQWR